MSLNVPDTYKRPRLLYESGKSAARIAEEIGCDRRTAARLIRENRDVSEIGKWHESHKKLRDFTAVISRSIQDDLAGYSSLYAFSQMLVGRLFELGYTGSERTLRNHLSRNETVREHFRTTDKKGKQLHVENNKHRKPYGNHPPRGL